MLQRIARNVLTLSTVAVLSIVGAFGQNASARKPTVNSHIDNWQTAQLLARSEKKLDVVALDQPERRQSCHIQSFTPEQLICSHLFHDSHTYLPQQVLALIVPGDEKLRLPLFFGFNAGLGAAIWGTVALAAVCPPCAAATGVAALFFFGAAGSTAFGDGQQDRLLYLAPGQQPTIMLRSLTPLYPEAQIVTPAKDQPLAPASSTHPAQSPAAPQTE